MEPQAFFSQDAFQKHPYQFLDRAGSWFLVPHGTHMYQLWPTIRDSLSTFISINVVQTSTCVMSMNLTWWYYSSSSWVHTLNGLLCYMIIRFKACILWHWRRYFGHKVNSLFTPGEMVDGKRDSELFWGIFLPLVDRNTIFWPTSRISGLSRVALL